MSDKKSIITNLLSVLLIILGYIVPQYGEIIKVIGFFAFSGAITNWVAIYMLFERIPLLYGSGIIPLQFEAFKGSMKKMIMEQFFTSDSLDRFFNSEAALQGIRSLVEAELQAVDYEKLYENIKGVFLNTSLGGMLTMFGGDKILLTLKEPAVDKLQAVLREVAENNIIPKLIDLKRGDKVKIQEKIEQMIELRLQELTPKQVKNLVKDLIGNYLGWIVIWGGVFGGLIGLIMELIFKIGLVV